ncbi:zinc-binding dehydrogenase [Gryllotalpicola reticulitermitis]|uniref:Zinc-binding dehydrogenase n=1 Tax=Gryllotalpicola reticulitermitis TaxID=1184153 RepID=A0ABV8Q565_9MICO
MRSAVIHGAGDVRVEDRPAPHLLTPGDAVLRVVAACVCGSDLWNYRGVSPVRSPRPIGHELVGVVEDLGADVTSVGVGDLVVVPFSLNCGECQACRAGYPSVCDSMTMVGGLDRAGLQVDGAQGEQVRIPLAQASLRTLGISESEAEARGLIPHLLALSDVMPTGYHAATSAQVGPGDVVAVVGDGAVGLSAVLAARLRGASRIIVMSRHEDRAALAREFGATDVIAERGAEATAAVRALLDGELADAALECVGTKESMDQALAVVRGGGNVGFVGVPAGGPELHVRDLFTRNIGVKGGMASARHYLDVLLPRVLDGTIEPGKVFTHTVSIDDVATAYELMDAREAIKVLVRP